MELSSLLAADYGFFLKMTGVVVVAVVAGYLIRKRPTPSHPKPE